VQKIGKRLDDSRVRVENTNIVVVVVFHDNIVAVKTALRNPFVSLRVGEAAFDSPSMNYARISSSVEFSSLVSVPDNRCANTER
jgi:hypothetical protein